MDQIIIALTGCTAIWLSQGEKGAKYASILGLIGQPFWFYATYQAEQWGIFILCFFYTIAWYRGFHRYWITQLNVSPHKG